MVAAITRPPSRPWSRPVPMSPLPTGTAPRRCNLRARAAIRRSREFWKTRARTDASRSLASEARANEGAGGRDRAAALFQLGCPQVPGVNHVGPDLEIDAHIGSPGPPGDPDRVVEQRL